jgi:hypothetical protein
MKRCTTGNDGLLTTIAVLALCALVPACTENAPCSATETFSNGYCYPTKDAAPQTVPDASVGEAGLAVGFGQACETTPDCPPSMIFCAKDPTSTDPGFCTLFGCAADPSICPSDWFCKDLTPYGLPQTMCSPAP